MTCATCGGPLGWARILFGEPPPECSRCFYLRYLATAAPKCPNGGRYAPCPCGRLYRRHPQSHGLCRVCNGRWKYRRAQERYHALSAEQRHARYLRRKIRQHHAA